MNCAPRSAQVALLLSNLLACTASANTPALAVASAPPQELDAVALQTGIRLFANCNACHTLGASEDDRVGPNLWKIFGARVAARPDFAYSEALQKSGINWTEEMLDKWITNPAALVPGNSMAFVGMSNPQERKLLLAYIRLRASDRESWN